MIEEIPSPQEAALVSAVVNHCNALAQTYGHLRVNLSLPDDFEGIKAQDYRILTIHVGEGSGSKHWRQRITLQVIVAADLDHLAIQLVGMAMRGFAALQSPERS